MWDGPGSHANVVWDGPSLTSLTSLVSLASIASLAFPASLASIASLASLATLYCICLPGPSKNVAILKFLAPTLALWVAPPIMSLIDTSVVGRHCL